MKPGIKNEHRIAWFLLTPAIASLFVFQYLQLGGLTVAFRTFSWRSPFRGRFIGLQNFRDIFINPSFTSAILNTVFYAVIAGTMITLVAVIIAGLFHIRSIVNQRPWYQYTDPIAVFLVLGNRLAARYTGVFLAWYA